MAENKKSFILYADIIHTVKKMPKDKIADLFVTILEYVNDENPVVEDLMVDLVFEPIKRQLKRDLEKWDGKIAKYSTAGREGGKKSGETRRNKANEATLQNASEIEAKRSDASEIEAKRSNASIFEANEAVNDNVTVNVNGNVIQEMPLGHEMQKLFVSINPRYPQKPSKDVPAMIEIACFIHESCGYKPKQMFEMDVGERRQVLSEWQKWCEWYRVNGNNRDLAFLASYKMQNIAMEIKNGRAKPNFSDIPIHEQQFNQPLKKL